MLGLGLGLLSGAALPPHAFAQGLWPSRPVKIVVPYPAGGTIGMDAVAKSDDGHSSSPVRWPASTA